MGLIARYEIKNVVKKARKKRATHAKPKSEPVPEQLPNASQWFQRFIDEGLICGARKHDKLCVFIRLCKLSHMAMPQPMSDLAKTGKGGGTIAPIESAARWALEKNHILQDVRESFERRFVDEYTEPDADLLRDVERGYVNFGDAKSALNNALIDIVRAADRRRPIIEVITSVCGIEKKREQ